MRIRFLGAAGDVTGSAYQVITKDASILVDCGFFQGRREESAKNRSKAQIEGGSVDAVVLTHGHLDHVGRLPLLTRNGYKGPIYATRPTIDLATLILKDSHAIQKQDLKRENQKRARKRQPPLEPLFEEADVRKLGPLVSPVKYNQRFPVARGIEARLVDAGHVIGSSSVELTVSENGHKKVVVFSGDLGPRGAPLLNDPMPFTDADAVIMESTYGDRNHRSLHDTAIEGREIIQRAIQNKAKIIVPVFAIGRTQLLLYLLGGAFKNKTLPPFPIYLDSPMAIEAHHHLSQKQRTVRCRGPGDGPVRRTETQPRDGAALCEARRIKGTQQCQRSLPDHGRQRHVHRRPDHASLAAQPADSRDGGFNCRFSIARNARSKTGGRRKVADDVWRGSSGACVDPYDGRL